MSDNEIIVKSKHLALSPIKSEYKFGNLGCPQIDGENDIGCPQIENAENFESAKSVHSVAIVKQSEVEFPVQFHQLQSNTDLKQPPSNWLQELSSQHILNPVPKNVDFSSFLMAHKFPENIGEVDVVCAAENIKKLLKIPYNPKGHVSMMIHRVNHTLLIDEFDVCKYLLRQSGEEWKWIRNFFFDHVLKSLMQPHENVLVRPNKSRDVVQSRNLLSKFLYHSISIGNADENGDSRQIIEDKSPISIVKEDTIPLHDFMPEPSIFESLPRPTTESYTRNIRWTFEDLKMFLGTDLPIFGGGTQPCVSLRLRDMSKPINILTGIDYWLDNLMCNVPEVVMCYHLDGIVQKYELIKTEDLPQTSDCPFSPLLIRDIAQNILSFLKSKATKEGHTYWLFKGKDDDIVKLYDLTSISEEEEETDRDSSISDKNPFTTPVGMLFYRVAKNLRSSEGRGKQATIRSLLQNSLNLLNKQRYPQIYSSALYMLSDLYVPQDTSTEDPYLSELSEDEDSLNWNEEVERLKREEELSRKKPYKKNKRIRRKNYASPSITVSSLCIPPKRESSKIKHDEFTMTTFHISERCNMAFKNSMLALECLQSVGDNIDTKDSFISPKVKNSVSSSTDSAHSSSARIGPFPMEEIDGMKRPCPFQPIPLPYDCSNTNVNKYSQSTESSLGADLETHEDIKTKGSKFGKQVKTPLIMIDSRMSNIDTASSLFPENEPIALVGNSTPITVSVLSSQYSVASWTDKLRVMHLQKISLIGLIMERVQHKKKKFGAALHYGQISIHSWCGMAKCLKLLKTQIPTPCQTLYLSGDIYYDLFKDFLKRDIHKDEFEHRPDEIKLLHDTMEKVIPMNECRWNLFFPQDEEESLMSSINCYQCSLDDPSATKQHDPKSVKLIKRKLGHISNDLASLYMRRANLLCDKNKSNFHEAKQLWTRSEKLIAQSLELMTEVNDVFNMALMHNNAAKLMRLVAYYMVKDVDLKSRVVTDLEKTYYEKSLDSYRRAMDLIQLLNKEQKREFYPTFIWEYSSTLFSFAVILIDFPSENSSVDQEQIDKKVSTYLNQCLKYCDITTPGPNKIKYQFRTASIHMRLAGMHHKHFRRNPYTTCPHFKLADVNYIRACCIFKFTEEPCDILKAHLDHCVLMEDYLAILKYFQSRLSTCISIVNILLDCLPSLQTIVKMEDLLKKSKKKSVKKESETDEMLMISLLKLFEKKLQNTLMFMIKVLIQMKYQQMSPEVIIAKEMYSQSLNTKGQELHKHLLDAVSIIKANILSLPVSIK